jgi:GTP1/Obg family GTP-binding protein
MNKNTEIPVESFLNTDTTLKRTAMLYKILDNSKEASATRNIAINSDRNYGDHSFKENQHIANEITKRLDKILKGFKQQKRVQRFYEASKLFDEHN